MSIARSVAATLALRLLLLALGALVVSLMIAAAVSHGPKATSTCGDSASRTISSRIERGNAIG